MPRPNVLLITTDHWPGYLFGHRNHPRVLTPTLDHLAACGTVFPRAYTECPVCIPARRSLMTGTPPRIHGDRGYNEKTPLPQAPLLAQTFRDAGYQAQAVGKLHVFPQRARLGFDDVILCEEGRSQFGVVDDYELYLGDAGFPGQQFTSGMNNNEYVARAWHLPEEAHVTNWTTRMMARQIQRRDPTRPGFWYCSYVTPHPPLQPPQYYLDLYRDLPFDPPMGDWAGDAARLPHALRGRKHAIDAYSGVPTSPAGRQRQAEQALRAFYAACTHIDHQLRVLIGTLREEGVLGDTIICFASDHGDMLGAHGLWGKRCFFEPSANIPMLLLGPQGDARVKAGGSDSRLVGLADVMPTLLDLAGIDVPSSVRGLSMVGPKTRQTFYGEIDDGPLALRMVTDATHKLIYYPAGNRVQLFDLMRDPLETHDVSGEASQAGAKEKLERALIAEFYCGDEAWARDGKLVGLPDEPLRATHHDRGMYSQRGPHWPPPPARG